MSSWVGENWWREKSKIKFNGLVWLDEATECKHFKQTITKKIKILTMMMMIAIVSIWINKKKKRKNKQNDHLLITVFVYFWIYFWFVFFFFDTSTDTQPASHHNRFARCKFGCKVFAAIVYRWSQRWSDKHSFTRAWPWCTGNIHIDHYSILFCR